LSLQGDDSFFQLAVVGFGFLQLFFRIRMCISQVLALSNNSIGDTGVAALASALTSSTGTGAASANADANADAASASASVSVVGSPLESLALGANPFGDAGATALAAALVNCTALRSLRCIESDEFTRALAIANNCNLAIHFLKHEWCVPFFMRK
jgi:hypothetical protein